MGMAQLRIVFLDVRVASAPPPTRPAPVQSPMRGARRSPVYQGPHHRRMADLQVNRYVVFRNGEAHTRRQGVRQGAKTLSVAEASSSLIIVTSSLYVGRVMALRRNPDHGVVGEGRFNCTGVVVATCRDWARPAPSASRLICVPQQGYRHWTGRLQQAMPIPEPRSRRIANLRIANRTRYADCLRESCMALHSVCAFADVIT